jgi:hypothetical protein
VGAVRIPIGVLLKRFRRRVRQREKLHHRRSGQRQWPMARARFASSILRLDAPVSISLRNGPHRNATLLFCQKIRQAYLQERLSVILDFSKTRKIAAEGMLVVVAEVDRSQRMGRSAQFIRCKLPDDQCDDTRIVRQVLDQIELLARTDHQAIHSDEDRDGFDDSVRNWRYATGTRVDDRPGDVLEKHEGRLAPPLMQRMQIGLTEALLNSLHHAYKGDRGDGCNRYRERRWWMFTQEDGPLLHVIACDLGIGIARSLPNTWDRNLLKKITQVFSDECPDVRAIKAALVLGQSSTGEENRGKGLPQIWNAIQATDVGVVGILSGNGYVGFTAENGEQSSGFFKSKMFGTVVSWKVPIETQNVNDNGTQDD